MTVVDVSVGELVDNDDTIDSAPELSVPIEEPALPTRSG